MGSVVYGLSVGQNSAVHSDILVVFRRLVWAAGGYIPQTSNGIYLVACSEAFAMSDFRDRRSVLRAGAALCSLTVAGCLGIGGSDGSNDGDGPGDDSDADGAEPDDTGGNESGTDGGNDTDGEDPGGDDTDWETIEAWPQLQYDAQNTGYVHAEAPTDVEQLWRV